MDKQKMICDVASSSNSTSMLFSKKYDVFLSFRGDDTRRSFTSFFYEALVQKKLETFMDDEELEKGDLISPALIKAIEDSHVSVVIFSKNYATSKWCLNELSKIMDCKKNQGQVVIPVFYDIDPSHVRKQTGSYKQAFEKHEQDKDCNKYELQKWKDALTEAANLAGWYSQTYRTEAEFLKHIVADIVQKLNKCRCPTELKELVGIQENYAEVESLLEIGSNEVRMIGMWGMGGIGKTTLATALYAKLYSQFEDHCFLTNVRERSEKFGINVLRTELCSKLLKEENLHIDVPGVDPDFVTSRLSHKKVLIVLDDVATLEQLKKLTRHYKGLGAGSRVLVTTRDKHIFYQADGIYEVKGLNFQDSLELFCLKAFRENQPPIVYQRLAERFVHYCGGNPLALTVLGADLHSRNKEVWESKLRKLEKVQHREIYDVLKLSFDDLDDTEKDIFLDIACFLKGESRDLVETLLEASGFFAASGIQVLSDKALITSSHSGIVEMHDLLQDLGREVVRQESITDPGRRSRLWRHEEVLDVLRDNRGTDVIEGITLDLSKIREDLCLSSDTFRNMSKLRFLKFYHVKCGNRLNVNLPDGLDSLSNNLRFFQWDAFPIEHLPRKFGAANLVKLCLRHSKIKKLWDGVKSLGNLKTIDLSYNLDLIQIPDLSTAPKLERLDLSSCVSLRELHPSTLALPKLRCLNLNGCRGIESLIVNCPSLEILDLGGCTSLKEFSLTSEELIRLNLDDTAICELPSSIWRNSKLKYLSLRRCINFKCVGNMFSDKGLQTLPHNIGYLSSLKELDLSGTNVESLPQYIKYLSMLITMKLDECKRLMSLPELPPSLQQLTTSNCISLHPDFTQRLVLQHMLQSGIHHLKLNDFQRWQGYFLLPGDHVTDERRFHTGYSPITIPYLPKLNLCGFIYCIILPREISFTDGWASCSVYEHCILVSDDARLRHGNKLILDHVLIWYHDISKFDRTRGASDHFRNISFKFEFHYCGDDREPIKKCGVFPLYASEFGLKLTESSSKEIFESGSITQISNHKSQLRIIEVEGSNN